MYRGYVLKSDADGRLYKGLSINVKQRLAQHNAGKVMATKAYRPWKVVYQEEWPSVHEAREREKYLKSGYGRAFLKSKGL